MPTIIHKKKKGHYYSYWVRSARVDGKPRIVEQVYLGPKERVLEEIRLAYSRGFTPGPSPLRKIQVKEFGASALLWHWAEKLNLKEIVDQHVPPVKGKRSTPLSVGQYLVIAAINRAIDAKSKRALYEHWFQGSVLSRLSPARQSDLTSQRFWDHMDQVEPEHIEAIQSDLLARLHETFPLGEETLLYDTTNYFSFIDTFNDRCELPQRGHNKQKRHDLRQLSLALFEDEKTGLPLYHQCYEGNRTDCTQFTDAWQAMVQIWMKGIGRRPRQMTLVFDAGNPTKENLGRLDDDPIHYVGAVPIGWVSDLLDIALTDYEKLHFRHYRQVKVHRIQHEWWGKKRTFLLVYSPSFYKKQRAAMNRLQGKVEEYLLELAEQIDTYCESRRGGQTEESVRMKIKNQCRRDRLHEFLELQIETDKKGKVIQLEWQWNLRKKRAVQRRYLGKRILVTDRDDWTDTQIYQAYNKLPSHESLFRISKQKKGPWWPMHHWTDSKIRVHALYCHFALLMLCIIEKQLRRQEIPMSSARAIERLKTIYETRVIYTNGAAERILSETDQIQNELAQALGLYSLAKRMGTTAPIQ